MTRKHGNGNGGKKIHPRPGADPALPRPPKIPKLASPTASRSRSPLRKISITSSSTGDFASDDELNTIDTKSDSNASLRSSVHQPINLPPTNSTSKPSVQLTPSNINANITSNQTPTNETKIPSPPPIIIPSTIWRKAASLIFQDPNLASAGLVAKLTADGKINLKTQSPAQFRHVQTILRSNQVDFHTHSLPADRQLKVIIRNIPTIISTEELQSELTALNYDVQSIRRFGTDEKPMPICSVSLSGINAKNIYNLSELFYLKISVEPFKKSGPSQCHKCQKFGHGSSNCGNSPTCVKCAGAHATSECTKTRDIPPTCANCKGPHTANYRGCPAFTESASSVKPKPTPPTPPTIPPQHTPPPQTTPSPTLSYAKVTKGTSPSPTQPKSQPQPQPKPQPQPQPHVSIQTIIALLSELLTAISTTDDPKIIISTTIASFIKLLSHNG